MLSEKASCNKILLMSSFIYLLKFCTKINFLGFHFPKCFKTFYLRDRLTHIDTEKKGERETERESVSLRIHFSNACKGQRWARLKMGVRKLNLIPPGGWWGLKYLSCYMVLPRVCVSRKLGSRIELVLEPRHSDMGYGCVTWVPYPFSHLYIKNSQRYYILWWKSEHGYFEGKG